MYCSASNIIYGTTELCLPFLFDILKNQVNKMVVQYENTYWWIQHSYFYWKVEKQSYICDISFWPQIYHITNMSQLCMWIAFLRWDLNIAHPKHAFLLQVDVDQERRVNHRGGKVWRQEGGEV